MASKRGRTDVEGNAVLSAQQYQRQMLLLAEQLTRFERVVELLDQEGCWLKGLSVKFPGEGRGSYLVVLRAFTEGLNVVAFQDGDTLAGALRQLTARLENRSIKWSEDKYGGQS